MVFADSDGVWEEANNLKPGIFGNDEGDSDSIYTFINPVIVNNSLIVNNNVTAQAYFYLSDKRLKEDIKIIENPIEKIKKINGVYFTWKSSGRQDIGLIAQNVESVIPQIVHTNNNGIKSVEYGNLVALLVETVKTQQQQIEDLQKRIEQLER
jgi:trimeric autotransporter adhesin